MVPKSDVTMVASSETKPIREFITAEDKPNCIGIRRIGMGGRYWFTERHITKKIEELEANLAFWQEAMAIFRKFVSKD